MFKNSVGVQVQGADGYIYLVPGMPVGYSPVQQAAAASPFQILTQTNGSNLQWGVSSNSGLFNSLSPQSKVAITGLLPASPTSSDTTWKNVSKTQDDRIWLEVTLGSLLTFSSASINTCGSGGSFDITANAWSANSYAETTATGQTVRALIGWSKVQTGSNPPVVTQCIFSNLLLTNTLIDGIGSRFPFPWDGGYLP